jgi:hypothetical protein
MDISELTIYKSNQSASMRKRKPNPKEKRENKTTKQNWGAV